ncbi:hypothetical protein HYDPIDRAFT_171535, partial [Hydnomerulius pinastri MD-312]
MGRWYCFCSVRNNAVQVYTPRQRRCDSTKANAMSVGIVGSQKSRTEHEIYRKNHLTRDLQKESLDTRSTEATHVQRGNLEWEGKSAGEEHTNLNDDASRPQGGENRERVRNCCLLPRACVAASVATMLVPRHTTSFLIPSCSSTNSQTLPALDAMEDVEEQIGGGRRESSPPPEQTSTRFRTKVKATERDSGIVRSAQARRMRMLDDIPTLAPSSSVEDDGLFRSKPAVYLGHVAASGSQSIQCASVLFGGSQSSSNDPLFPPREEKTEASTVEALMSGGSGVSAKSNLSSADDLFTFPASPGVQGLATNKSSRSPVSADAGRGSSRSSET